MLGAPDIINEVWECCGACVVLCDGCCCCCTPCQDVAVTFSLQVDNSQPPPPPVSIPWWHFCPTCVKFLLSQQVFSGILLTPCREVHPKPLLFELVGSGGKGHCGSGQGFGSCSCGMWHSHSCIQGCCSKAGGSSCVRSKDRKEGAAMLMDFPLSLTCLES